MRIVGTGAGAVLHGSTNGTAAARPTFNWQAWHGNGDDRSGT
ncbi:hypothetical protein [Xanthomonas axonopodis]